MKKIGNNVLFGFFKDAPYDYVTDELINFETLQNRISRREIIAHIEKLSPAVSSERGKDAFTGENYQAMQYDDGNFVFPVDVLRYLKQGKIGIPKEYENYLINEYGM